MKKIGKKKFKKFIFRKFNFNLCFAGSAGPSSASLIAYDDIVNGPFKTYLDLSKRIGSEVATIGEMVEAAFKAHRAYLEMASKAKKPSPGDLPTLQKPMGDKINEIQTYREAGRRCQFFNHLSAISESIPALGWINMSPTPAPFVKEMNDAGMFYTNRVLKDWKDKSKAHVEWTKAWIQTLTQLQGWVKEFHTMCSIASVSFRDNIIHKRVKSFRNEYIFSF